MDTVKPEIPEKYYWRIIQAMAAAGTASHRHGMERHAAEFHEAEKYLYQAYEQQEPSDDGSYIVRVMYRGEQINTIDATSATLESTIAEVLESHPNRYVIVENNETN
jgi:TPR repeat protein